MTAIEEALQNNILVLDGAMGTMLQAYKFNEADFRGDRFTDHPCSLQGNNDMLSLTQPEAIKTIHRKYFEVGADIVETNTFSSTSIGMGDYEMEAWVYELNFESAKLAREVADEFTKANPISNSPAILLMSLYLFSHPSVSSPLPTTKGQVLQEKMINDPFFFPNSSMYISIPEISFSLVSKEGFSEPIVIFPCS